MATRHEAKHARTGRPAFSYVEALISVVILGTGIVAGLHLYGSFARGMVIDSETAVAQQLAADLMAEIMNQAFEDPALAVGSFGPGGDESTRRDFDDVDDYDGWTESPPADPDGAPLAGGVYTGYQRQVTVWNVDPATLSTPAGDGTTAAKAIQVVVSRNGRQRAVVTAHRTRHRAYE